MSIWTVILLIVAFVLILLKPTYVAIYAQNPDGQYGTYIGCCSLIVALFFKVQFYNEVMILTGKQYDKCYQFFMDNGAE